LCCAYNIKLLIHILEFGSSLDWHCLLLTQFRGTFAWVGIDQCPWLWGKIFVWITWIHVCLTATGELTGELVILWRLQVFHQIHFLVNYLSMFISHGFAWTCQREQIHCAMSHLFVMLLFKVKMGYSLNHINWSLSTLNINVLKGYPLCIMLLFEVKVS
jgi:hypothetical protein